MGADAGPACCHTSTSAACNPVNYCHESPPVPTTVATTGSEKPRVLQMVTDATSASLFMAGQLGYLRDQGFEVAVASSPGPALDTLQQREQVQVFPIPMSREIAPFNDLHALRHTFKVVQQFQPHVVSAGTPKAGLLGMLAARMARVPVRIYMVRGLRLETARGGKRKLLTLTERLTCRCAGTVLCVSPSLRERFSELGLCVPEKLLVLAEGSSNGVRTGRFAATAQNLGRAKQLAAQLNLPMPDASPGRSLTVGFVGRLTRDKGIVELCDAFFRLKERWPDAKLLLVGDFEAGDPVPTDVRARLAASADVVITGFVRDPSLYYHLMGQLVLPSHREGFPNAPLEAAAAGLPVVAFDATGTRDAVVHQQTGTLVAVGDVPALADAIGGYLESPALRMGHGLTGKRRVETEFQPERIWSELATLYRRRLRDALPEHEFTTMMSTSRAA